MDGERRVRAGGVIWGLCLIGLGAVFLLQRAGLIGFAKLSSMWPLVFFAIAIGHAFDRRPGSALTMLLMGLWFFAVQFGWNGLTYRNSWSLVLVAVGCGIVVKALTGEERRRRGCGGLS